MHRLLWFCFESRQIPHCPMRNQNMLSASCFPAEGLGSAQSVFVSLTWPSCRHDELSSAIDMLPITTNNQCEFQVLSMSSYLFYCSLFVTMYPIWCCGLLAGVTGSLLSMLVGPLGNWKRNARPVCGFAPPPAPPSPSMLSSAMAEQCGMQYCK